MCSALSESAVFDERVRCDQWLWAARFYKTRRLACEAVLGGKVKLNGRRIKPAHIIRVGDQLDVVIADHHWQLNVTALSKRRASAPIAQTLYQETAWSLAQRQTRQIERQHWAKTKPLTTPNKKDRRALNQWHGQWDVT